MDYKNAGVDIEAGYKSVELMKKHIKTTMRPEVLGGIGGFAGAFSLAKIKEMKEPVLLSGTDGCGTKVQLAYIMDKHDTIGIDAVAMCVNDIACSGGEPLFFLDYIACGKNYPEKIATIVSGVAEGCNQSGAALVGGETAEHPGLMPENEYDLAGFAVGVVEKDELITGENIKAGDTLIGIAACNGQGCEMKDKFRENFWIAFPAAVITLILILVLSFQTDIQGQVSQTYNLVQIIPYVLVLIGGIIGLNVFIVLLMGIVSGAFIMLIWGHTAPVDLLTNMGSGVSGMFETCMVAILVAALCALIREYGGFDALLSWIHRIFRGKKGGQLGMGLLVGTMDIATANNTVAIVMANPIAGEMAQEYGISPKKTASLLDTFSCIFQGVIPYGAQMLVAIAAVGELGDSISAFQIMPKLFYPMFLLLTSLVTIIRSDK